MAMEIIPVLDLKGGFVVRGVMGDRANYRPIVTPLSISPRPVDVARGLAALGRFAAFYIADLDAIEGTGDNMASVARLTEAFPDTQFWVDAGVRTLRQARAHLLLPKITVVLGSETVERADVVGDLSRHERVVLSLDYRGEAFMGPLGLATDAALWPRRVIAMTLAKVGSEAGPDLLRLSAVKAMAAGREVFAAGGVRDAADLEALRQAGIAGALVASALHDGRLDAAALRRYGA